MAFFPEPTGPFTSMEAMQAYYERQFQLIASEFALLEQGTYLPLLGAAPIKPKEGQVVAARAGVLGLTQGLYEYRSAAWVKL